MGFRGSRVQIPPSRFANTDAGPCPRSVFAIGTPFFAIATRLRLVASRAKSRRPDSLKLDLVVTYEVGL
jgi:hypothetical protein